MLLYSIRIKEAKRVASIHVALEYTAVILYSTRQIDISLNMLESKNSEYK